MKLGTVIIHVEDVRRAIEFYEKAFAQKRLFIDESNQYGELDIEGGARLGFARFDLVSNNLGGIHLKNSRDNKPGPIEISFHAHDIKSAYDYAVSCGAEPVMKPLEKPWGQTIAYVRDLDGTLVQLETPMDMSQFDK